jgi:hypothetical protein
VTRLIRFPPNSGDQGSRWLRRARVTVLVLDIIVVVAGLERDGRHCSPDGFCVDGQWSVVDGRWSLVGGR